jgi:hypothetical protein
VPAGDETTSPAYAGQETMMATALETVRDHSAHEYKYGFVTDIESEVVAKGLSEDTSRLISAKKHEPSWMTDWRLKAFARWQTMDEPDWAKVDYPPIDFQAISYYAAPKSNDDRPKSLDEVDPELLRTYEKLGIPVREQELLAGVAVDYVFDSVSVATTFKKKLGELGIIFCSISEAVADHPELVAKYLGSVVPQGDNFFAALNSAVFTDGSFVYVPKGVRCPMELSTYFRINAAETGQFERTLIIAEAGAYVSHLEGCTAPQRDENQLHAAVVELIALDDAEIKYTSPCSPTSPTPQPRRCRGTPRCSPPPWRESRRSTPATPAPVLSPPAKPASCLRRSQKFSWSARALLGCILRKRLDLPPPSNGGRSFGPDFSSEPQGRPTNNNRAR